MKYWVTLLVLMTYAAHSMHVDRPGLCSKFTDSELLTNQLSLSIVEYYKTTCRPYYEAGRYETVGLVLENTQRTYTFERLVRKYPHQIHTADKNGLSPFHYAVAFLDLSAVQVLLAHKANACQVVVYDDGKKWREFLEPSAFVGCAVDPSYRTLLKSACSLCKTLIQQNQGCVLIATGEKIGKESTLNSLTHTTQ